MNTNKSLLDKVVSLDNIYEYSLVVITKANSGNVYGIAALNMHNNKELCRKEIGTDKGLVLSIVDILNKYRIPHVHFHDIINDLINEQY